MRKLALAFTFLLSFATVTANAQYFGRKKPRTEATPPSLEDGVDAKIQPAE